MSTKASKNFLNANISKVYAISLTHEKKRQLMKRIDREIDQHNVLSDGRVRTICSYLNQCFEAETDTILLALEIVTKLLSRGVAEYEVIASYRKLLTYVSSALDAANCKKFAVHLTRITTIALQNGTISPEGFPVTIVKCILVLTYRLPIVCTSDRNIILEALRSTLQWSKLEPVVYKQCGFGTLIRCAITSMSQLQDDLAAVTELTFLARHILDVFYTPQTNVVHPVEVLLRSAYHRIFTRLVLEWTDIKCYELLLYVLFDVLKRNIQTYLKLDIVRALADAAGGGTRRLVRLLCIPRHLQDENLLRIFKTILTIILAHSLFRYEPTKRAPHFSAFLKMMKKMVNSVDFTELVTAKFLCLNLPRAKLTTERVCFLFVLRHLELLEGITSRSIELDYVYNLIASVNIVYHKRWKLPRFLLKHFIDGLSRYSTNNIFEKNVSDPEKKLKAILSTSEVGFRGHDAVGNIFGRLPPTVERIQWIQMQPVDFRAEFIFHQQLEILQERYIVTGDHGLIHSLLTIFQTDTLLAVLSTRQASAMARRNASLLLSKCTLKGAALEKVVRQIKRSQHQKETNNLTTICNWVRAVYGSMQSLDSRSKRVLWKALSAVHQETSCSDEQRVLLVDTKACLLISMMLEMKGNVIQMHVEGTRDNKPGLRRIHP